jgi:aspartate kinase
VPVVVHKYGGSSLADLDRLRRVAARIQAARDAGDQPVVVVSAMGDTTNQLIALAHEVADEPDRRELDMLVSVGERVAMSLLALCLRSRGVPARSLTGSQSGIVTDERHADARVVEVRPDRLREALAQGVVPIVAGFQGVSRTREITTLGRGGSDTTAVALAAALQAVRCEICSDVDGVWTADPRQVPEARRIDALSHDDMWALSQAGATVLFEDAVRLARERGVVLHAAATFTGGQGTRVGPVPRPTTPVGVAGDVLWRVPEAALGALPAGIRLRRRAGGFLWVDARNAHGARVEGGVRVGVVTLVGGGIGEEPRRLSALDHALMDVGGRGARGAAADVAWWEVEEDRLQDALRLLHAEVIHE